MREPEYVYQKGLGWVVAPPTQVFFVQDLGGRPLRVTVRAPLDGEAYMYTHDKDSEWIRPDSNINEVAVRKHACRFHYHEWAKWREGRETYPKYIYMVLEPV